MFAQNTNTGMGRWRGGRHQEAWLESMKRRCARAHRSRPSALARTHAPGGASVRAAVAWVADNLFIQNSERPGAHQDADK